MIQCSSTYGKCCPCNAEILRWHPNLLFHPRHPMSCISLFKAISHARVYLTINVTIS